MKAGYLLDVLSKATHKMRVSQRDYFKTKSNAALNDSKKHEKEVDNILFNIKQLKDSNQIEES